MTGELFSGSSKKWVSSGEFIPGELFFWNSVVTGTAKSFREILLNLGVLMLTKPIFIKNSKGDLVCVFMSLKRLRLGPIERAKDIFLRKLRAFSEHPDVCMVCAQSDWDCGVRAAFGNAPWAFFGVRKNDLFA